MVPSKDGGRSAPLTEKYDAMLNYLHMRNNEHPLTSEELADQRKELKRLARKVKLSTIDEDYPNPEKEWKDVANPDKEYYMGLLEIEAHKNKLDIYLCKANWGARNLLQEACKIGRMTAKRTRIEREKMVS